MKRQNEEINLKSVKHRADDLIAVLLGVGTGCFFIQVKVRDRGVCSAGYVSFYTITEGINFRFIEDSNNRVDGAIVLSAIFVLKRLEPSFCA